MSQNEIVQALWMWQWDYAEGSAYEVTDYLHAVCQTAELKTHFGEIRRNLIRHMSQGIKDLGPDPWPLMRDYANAMKMEEQSAETETTVSQKEPIEIPDDVKVLTFVLNHMLDAMLQQNPVYCARVRSWTAGNLVSVVPVSNTGLYSEWLLNETNPPEQSIGRESMRRLVNLLYVAGCEYFGPTVVDKMLHKAFAAAEDLPEARQFSPKELL
jgi:hypothetical protein